MHAQRGDGQEWSLYWTARGQEIRCQLVPLLEGWADLDQRKAGADVGERQPILIDPQYRIDPVLARFLRWSRFSWLTEGSREAYAKDYRLFFSFLWGRGKYWLEADPDDLLDWESWRRRGPGSGQARDENADLPANSATCAPNATSTSKQPTRSPAHSTCSRLRTTSCAARSAGYPSEARPVA